LLWGYHGPGGHQGRSFVASLRDGLTATLDTHRARDRKAPRPHRRITTTATSQPSRSHRSLTAAKRHRLAGGAGRPEDHSAQTVLTCEKAAHP
ncbi:hypothetical protein ACH498_24965, partial [Rhodococcus erythropolis]